MGFRLVVSGSAERRREAALAFLDGVDAARPALVIGAGLLAARTLVFDAVRRRGAAFGWQPMTLELAARRLAVPALAAARAAPIGGAAATAVVARVLFRLGRRGELGRYEPVAAAPGLAPALARTIAELRAAGLEPEALAAADGDLARVYAATLAELADLGLADRAQVFGAAAAATTPWAGAPLVLLDVAAPSPLETALVRSLAAAASGGIATALAGDDRSITALERALGVSAERRGAAFTSNLARAREHLFAAAPERREADDSLELFSAPDESRECVEIARRVQALAAAGTRFDEIAVLLRAPSLHRAHLEEAFARAGVPAHFARGTTRPDPAGRALLTLLDCADEGLSARAFAEYLSLSVTPAGGAAADFAAPEELPRPEAVPETEAPPSPPEAPPAPRRWERFIVDAAVIGGLDRWRRRLAGRAAELRLAAEAAGDPDEPRAARLAADLAALEALERFALPILERLDRLPASATWAVWLEHLRRLAAAAIREPGPVLASLAELEPMGPVGPVGLLEVRAALAARLGELAQRPGSDRAGKVLVADIDRARGLALEVVFVPGLAETVFPAKVQEDPILLDEARVAIGGELATNAERVEDERTLLRVAAGAARRRLVLSYARQGGAQARPRVPSFYGLELLRAGEGELPSLAELARRAREAGGSRLAWPAPVDAGAAIDETEYDLAVLESLLRSPEKNTGAARYLVETSPELARALRFRARRWSLERWTSADGLVAGPDDSALADHQLDRRAYSATSLQHFADCPYRFYLRSIARLAPRQMPAPLEDLGPLERGKLIHEVQFRFLMALGDGDLGDLDAARALLEAALDEVAERAREELAPAIDRVWQQGIAEARRDLEGWLERLATSPWRPIHAELGFGLPPSDRRDPASRPEPVTLESGLTLRGAIDSVERSDGRLRATDDKTGRRPYPRFLVVGGGRVLQPALYALVLEKLFPGEAIEGGRLYYCSERGEYAEEIVPLDEGARGAVAQIAGAVGEALARGFLPAAPDDGACARCDYLPICGPHEELRARRKDPRPLAPLVEIRRLP